MDDVIAQALADAEAIETGIGLSESDLQNVTKLAEEQMRLEDLVALLEEKTKEANESLRKISENHLPDAMMKSDLKSIELNDGSKLTRSKKYIGSITKANEEEAFKWFKETKRGGVVTTNIALPVGKGRMDEGETIADALREQGYNIELKHSVHWQTLRGVVRELYESGDQIPSCISTHVIDQATIKRKK